MLDVLTERMKINANCDALISRGQSYSYRELLDAAIEDKAKFEKAGITENSTVVILGDFSFRSICSLLACLMVKSTVIPLTKEAHKKLEYQLNVMKPDFLIDTFSGTIRNISVKNKASGRENWRALLPISSSGLIVFTSGTTGTPKAVVHSVDALCYRYISPKPPLNFMCFLKFDHMGGVNTLLGIFFRGGTATVPSRLDPETICCEIEIHKVNVLPATPSFLTQLVMSQAAQQHDLSSLKVISYGTEVMSESILLRLNREFPQCKLKQTYGLSETGVFNIKSKSNQSLWFKFEDPGVQTKVLDDILYIKTKSNLIGQLVFKNDEVIPVSNEKDWFCTDDVVETDGDYFKIQSRTTDIINVGGLKVYPIEVESCILQLGYVQDVTVLGKKNALLGQMIVAYVRLADGIELNDVKKELHQHCIAWLERYKVPSKFIVDNVSFVNDRFKKVRR